MKIYCEMPSGKRFATQGAEEGEKVIVKVGSRAFRLPRGDLDEGFAVFVQDWTFEKYSSIEHDSKLRGMQKW